MAMMEAENTNAEHSRRGNPAWGPGVSGNPAGRPPGARNKATVAAEALLDGDAEAIASKAVELAMKGQMGALRLSWNAFVRRGRIGRSGSCCRSSSSPPMR
jgi:hypothetical protein